MFEKLVYPLFNPSQIRSEEEFLFAATKFLIIKGNQKDILIYALIDENSDFSNLKEVNETSYRYDESIKWLFKLGNDYGVLSCDFESFQKTLMDIVNRMFFIEFTFEDFLRTYYRRHVSSSYIFRRRSRHQKSTKYVRLPHHAKKAKSEKSAWRDFKKFTKDKRKCHYRRSWKKFMKKTNSRKLRNQERKLIQSLDFDGLSSNFKIEDSWNYD